jgi:exonuclease SbcC
MRLHRLSVTAFGPFSGTQHVDFDVLCASGLFLLCGPTGAGKTSVLDAVCFALFGHVPGEREKARGLRSDHAPPGVGPRVVLEATMCARRLRITRSPEWSRPKKRGLGSTKEPARILVEEHVQGRWEQRTSRIDEASDLLGGLVGLTLGQFCQVALLPQGRFESFLKAGAQERRDLLERLFDAQRFRAIEDWLVQHRKALGRQSAEHATGVAALLARIGEVSELAPPVDPSGSPCLDDDARRWSATVRDDLVGRLADAHAERTAADRAVKAARAELDEARTLATLQERQRDAVRRGERLDALAGETAQLRVRLDDARRAEAVAPVAALHYDAVGAASKTRATVRAAGERAAPWLSDAVRGATADAEPPVSSTGPSAGRSIGPPEWVEAELAALARRLRADTARVAALQPMQDELDELDHAGAEVHAALAAQDRLRDQAAATLAGIVAQQESAQAELARARPVAATVETRGHQLEVTEQQVAAARRAAAAARRRDDLAARLAGADAAALQAKEAWLDARQARLDGMAAELAAGLLAGERCPVCGSREHPAPAGAGQQQVTAAEERTAERRYQLTERARSEAERELRAGVAELAGAAAAAGGLDVASAEHARDLARIGFEEAQQARRTTADLTLRQQRLAEDEQEAATSRGIDSELARLRERQHQLADRRGRVTDALAAAVGEAPRLADRLAAAREAEAAVQALLDAWTRWRDSCLSLTAAERRLAQVVRRQGFRDAAQAREALVSAAELANLEALLQQRALEEQQVAAVLADPAVRHAAGQPAADPAVLQQGLSDRERRRDGVLASYSDLAGRADRLEILHSELEASLAAWEPVQRGHRVACDLAGLCTGTSVDNPQRIRLSSYVLAARLAQVVAAANERLDRMTGGRYLLEYTQDRGVGDRRGGLGLRVHDGWTGHSRDPATLSGGESFVAALALALGLADVVTHEAGGVELGTLFVDEGFGALDAETLDEVIDVLDDLRNGGRAVGLVSHVPELRARVAARLQVTKTRHGSTLAQG